MRAIQSPIACFSRLARVARLPALGAGCMHDFVSSSDWFVAFVVICKYDSHLIQQFSIECRK